MAVTILRGDARALPLANESIDLIITSPPYFALRSYTDGGAHYEGQIGSEATPAAYIAALLDCTREWVRVLKPSGSIFVNLGDKYSGSRMDGSNDKGISANPITARVPTVRDRTSSAAIGIGRQLGTGGIPAKSLMLLPERYRIACVDELGLIARAVIVWSKPNGLPESVTDRVRRSHEDWVHLTVRPRYFSAVDEIREPHQPQSLARTHRNRFAPDLSQSGIGSPNTLNPGDACNPLGKLPGSVWEIATEPLIVPPDLGVDHFAAFPSEWPRRLILGWSPSGICCVCGEGRRPVVDKDRAYTQRTYTGSRGAAGIGGVTNSIGRQHQWLPGRNEVTLTGEACACPDLSAPTRRAVVLDPFGGTGTTALVADVLGRDGISVDMSADYCRLAAWRTTDPGERARAMRVPKPEQVHEDQLALFEGVA